MFYICSHRLCQFFANSVQFHCVDVMNVLNDAHPSFQRSQKLFGILGLHTGSNSGDTENKKLSEDWKKRVSYFKMCLLRIELSRGVWAIATFSAAIWWSIQWNDKWLQIFSGRKCFFPLYHSLDTENVATAASDIFYLGNSEVWREKNLFIQHDSPCLVYQRQIHEKQFTEIFFFCYWYLYNFLL